MVRIKVALVEGGGAPVGKLADVELHFVGGLLDGHKLLGFAVWERRGGGGLNVTNPARTYSVNGERRSFALLRPVDYAGGLTSAAASNLRDAIVTAYQATVDGDRAGAAAVVDAPVVPARGISPDTLAALASRLV